MHLRTCSLLFYIPILFRFVIVTIRYGAANVPYIYLLHQVIAEIKCNYFANRVVGKRSELDLFANQHSVHRCSIGDSLEEKMFIEKGVSLKIVQIIGIWIAVIQITNCDIIVPKNSSDIVSTC